MNRWENSDYYARTFSPLLAAGVLRMARWDFTISQMTNLFTAQVQLFPPQTGYAYFPVLGNLIRAGAPYATQPGTVLVRWITAAGAIVATSGVSWASATQALNGVVSATPPLDNATITLATGSTGGASDNPATIGSKGLALGTGVGSPTVTAALPGAPVTLLLAYYLIPTYQSLVGGPILPTS